MQATQGTLSSLPSVCLSYAFPTRSQSVCPAPTSPSHSDHPPFSLFLLLLFSSTSCLPQASWVSSLIFVIISSFPICLSTPIFCLSLSPALSCSVHSNLPSVSAGQSPESPLFPFLLPFLSPSLPSLPYLSRSIPFNISSLSFLPGLFP